MSLGRQSFHILSIVPAGFSRTQWNSFDGPYTEADVGRFKAEVLAERLQRMNSEVTVTHHSLAFDETSGTSLLTTIDAVLDGTDNHGTRLLIDRFTAHRGLPWFMGAAVQMAGQNIAFTGLREEGCYHCLAPQQASVDAGGCAKLGILGGGGHGGNASGLGSSRSPDRRRQSPLGRYAPV